MKNEENTTFFENRGGKPPKLFVIRDMTTWEFDLNGRQVFGREDMERNIHPDLVVNDKSVSRPHGEFYTNQGICNYKNINHSNGTIHNGIRLQQGQSAILSDGDVMRVRRRNTKTMANDLVMIYSTSYIDDLEWKSIPLNDEISAIDIGRSQDLTLTDTAVSRYHASLVYSDSGWGILDHSSKNGVFVNGHRIRPARYLMPMDVIRIAGYHFVFTGSALLYQIEREASLGARGTGSTVTGDGSRGGNNPPGDHPADSDREFLSIKIQERSVWQRFKKKTLLKDINLKIQEGSLVLIFGGSGAGKTTFMHAVMGYEKANKGEILYKQENLYKEYKRLKYEIGYVPQEILLNQSDTVYKTIEDSAKMRYPKELTKEGYRQMVMEVLEMFHLSRLEKSQVRSLSGGEQKRLSVAVEYVGNPSLFFLDEPDSGLDAESSIILFQILRKIADQGKIVLMISHNPERGKEYFDSIIFLGKSKIDNVGHLVFHGSVTESERFFDTDSFDQISKMLSSEKVDTLIQKNSTARRN